MSVSEATSALHGLELLAHVLGPFTPSTIADRERSRSADSRTMLSRTLGVRSPLRPIAIRICE